MFILAILLLMDDAAANAEYTGLVIEGEVLTAILQVVDALVIFATTVAEVGWSAPLHI
jgi:hypothetical protein